MSTVHYPSDHVAGVWPIPHKIRAIAERRIARRADLPSDHRHGNKVVKVCDRAAVQIPRSCGSFLPSRAAASRNCCARVKVRVTRSKWRSCLRHHPTELDNLAGKFGSRPRTDFSGEHFCF